MSNRIESVFERADFARVRRASLGYARALKGIARQIGLLLTGYDPVDPESMRAYRQALDRYADLILPWARNQADRMLVDVSRRDRAAWARHAQGMSRELKAAIGGTDVGEVTRRLQEAQVGLIMSIPREAALRVQRLSMEAVSSGARAGEIVKEIMRTEEVARSRAETIARTEVSRAASNFQQARAESAGSRQYVWRSAMDRNVRKDHRELNGKVFSWDDPPVADQRSGARAHPGCIYNCRCYAEPIIPL